MAAKRHITRPEPTTYSFVRWTNSLLDLLVHLVLSTTWGLRNIIWGAIVSSIKTAQFPNLGWLPGAERSLTDHVSAEYDSRTHRKLYHPSPHSLGRSTAGQTWIQVACASEWGRHSMQLVYLTWRSWGSRKRPFGEHGNGEKMKAILLTIDDG